MTPSRLDRELVFPSSSTKIDEDSSVNNNELFCSKLAWGNLRRRQGIGKAEAATDPVLRFAIIWAASPQGVNGCLQFGCAFWCWELLR